MDLEYRRDVRDSEPLRASFNALTRQTFGFDFADWYAGGWWTPERTGYTPHVLTAEGRVVANVSTTSLCFELDGQPLRATQLGTVMTAPEWQGRGLQRRLMERVLEEAESELVYLYANDSVMDFYPRFGFVPAEEQVFSLELPRGEGPRAVPADMDDPADRAKLLRRYALGNPFSAASMQGETGLLMFYCGGFLREGVRFIDSLEAAAVAEYEGDTLILHDVFCPPEVSPEELLRALAAPGISRAELGFTPKETRGMRCAPVEEDGGLFVLAEGCNPFAGRPLRLPTLSHT